MHVKDLQHNSTKACKIHVKTVKTSQLTLKRNPIRSVKTTLKKNTHLKKKHKVKLNKKTKFNISFFLNKRAYILKSLYKRKNKLQVEKNHLKVISEKKRTLTKKLFFKKWFKDNYKVTKLKNRSKKLYRRKIRIGYRKKYKKVRQHIFYKNTEKNAVKAAKRRIYKNLKKVNLWLSNKYRARHKLIVTNNKISNKKNRISNDRHIKTNLLLYIYKLSNLKLNKFVAAIKSRITVTKVLNNIDVKNLKGLSNEYKNAKIAAIVNKIKKSFRPGVKKNIYNARLVTRKPKFIKKGYKVALKQKVIKSKLNNKFIKQQKTNINSKKPAKYKRNIDMLRNTANALTEIVNVKLLVQRKQNFKKYYNKLIKKNQDVIEVLGLLYEITNIGVLKKHKSTHKKAKLFNALVNYYIFYEFDNLKRIFSLKHKKKLIRHGGNLDLFRPQRMIKWRLKRLKKLRRYRARSRKVNLKALRKWKQMIRGRRPYVVKLNVGKYRASPLGLFQFILQSRKSFILPPNNKTFKLLKVLLLAYKLVFTSNVGSSLKKQFFYITLLRQSLMSILKLPGYKPKFYVIRILNLLLLKEYSYKQKNVYYFKKVFASRFLIFQGAHSAIASSVKAFDKNDKISVIFSGIHVKNISASFICNYIIYKLGQYFSIQEILRPLIYDLSNSTKLAGFRIVVAGRLTRKERAAYLIRQKGRVTLSKKSALIDYAADFKIMRFGVVGVKVWFYRKKINPNLYVFKFTSTF